MHPISRFLAASTTAILLCAGSLRAQTYLNHYEGAISQRPESVCQLDDGSIVLAGPGADTFVVDRGVLTRVDALGDVIWSQSYEENEQEKLREAEGSADGELFAAGTLGFRPWLIKVERATGSILWQRQLERDGEFFALAALDDGVAAAGITFAGDVLVTRFDLDGNQIWEGTYGWSDSNEVAHALECGPSGELIVGANTTHFTGSNDLWVLALEENGDVRWATAAGEVNSLEGTEVDLDVTSAGAVYMTGALNFGGPFEDNALVARFTNEGALDWIQSMDLEGGADESRGIAATADEGCVVLSHSRRFGHSTDLWLTRLDRFGQQLWERVVIDDAADEFAGGVATTRFGGILLTGSQSDDQTFFDALHHRIEDDGSILQCDSLSSVTSSARFESVDVFSDLPPFTIHRGIRSQHGGREHRRVPHRFRNLPDLQRQRTFLRPRACRERRPRSRARRRRRSVRWRWPADAGDRGWLGRRARLAPRRARFRRKRGVWRHALHRLLRILVLRANRARWTEGRSR